MVHILDVCAITQIQLLGAGKIQLLSRSLKSGNP